MEAQMKRLYVASASYARLTCAALTLVIAASSVAQLHAAAYRTANFTVAAPTPQLAKAIGDTAESCRKELAIEWLGKPLPNWPKPCPIKARVAPNLGAGGATSFVFDRGKVFGWRMDIQGSAERVLDSVVPHEVTHTIFASHFRRPLPRWADEGACTTVEHHSEIGKQERMLIEFLKTHRGIPFSDMFAMKEYPRDVLPLYAQGHSLAKYLIAQKGKRAFMAFVADGLTDEDWPRAIEDNYSYPHLLALQNSWLDWVRKGRPDIVASNDRTQRDVILAASEQPIVRGQDPDSTPKPRTRRSSNEPPIAALAATGPRDNSTDWPVTPTPGRSGKAISPYARAQDASLRGTVRR
ncbi:hypothetical protein [Adhaeretor mobilis]|uniref:Peptidase MA-like domain-containing protein n=1 Tax=Adhaeretor mobilis TaxID=1930276 RepID=A0A517MXD7_9BACT|nr:hypothetical protein [Adhaeretor mobilis]QDS99542.1 hypothetical protein HG15A2_28660 [Adhaeretor mobilis]